MTGQDWIFSLKENFEAGQIRESFDLAALTTYRLGGPGDWVLFPRDMEQCARMVGILHSHGVHPALVIGRGANLLISDAGVRGVTLATECMSSAQVCGNLLVAEAGLSSDAAAEMARDAGLSGLEFLAGLPGTLGGAVWMNARAFERDMASVLERVELVEPDGSIRVHEPSVQEFSYKVSPYQSVQAIIGRVTLRLSFGDPVAIGEAMERHREVRRARGEDQVLSCGCVFQNPVTREAPAGRLIDSCGLKGYGTEHAWVYGAHANFIIHDGQSTASELRNLLLEVQSRVARETGVWLEPEVRFVGDFPEDAVSVFHHDPARAGKDLP